MTANCFAADFHYAEGAIYFTDDTRDVIGRVNMDGSGLKYVVTGGIMKPHGIAVDWVAGNIYWTDMGTKLIEVSRTQECVGHCWILVSEKQELDSGYLLWYLDV